MVMPREDLRSAFQDFVEEWMRRLEKGEADVEANDTLVDLRGKKVPARFLFFWLRNDQGPLPPACTKSLGYARGITYGQAATLLSAELVARRSRMYWIKVENPTNPCEPYFLAATTDAAAIEEAQSLFEPDVDDLPTLETGEIAVIRHENRRVAEIHHGQAGTLVKKTFPS
jgi:hypothetical protein